MLVLALDTSSPAVSVAVADSEQTRAELAEIATNRHGEILAFSIDRVLRQAGVTPAELTAVAVGTGPGPFTGLRVGIVTARAMSDALGIPAYGECSLDVIAAAHAGHKGLAVLSDARRRQVYWARYDESGRRVDGPELAPPVQVAAQLHGKVSQVVGAGALLYPEEFADFVVDEGGPYPDAARLISLTMNRHGLDAASDDLAPLYLRRPDAQVPGRPKAVTPS